MSNSERNIVEAAVDNAKQVVHVAERYELYEGIPVAVDIHGDCHVMSELDKLLRERKADPPRRSGTSHHTELDSFIDHVNRTKEEETTIWADVNRCLFTAIYNYDPAGSDPSQAGWADHQAKYLCPLSPEWIAWTQNQSEWMTQDAFAQWIDSRMEDLVEVKDGPKPIEMLEMARNLQIFTTGTHTKKIDPTTGQFALVCKQEHTSDSTQIPRSFGTALRIFEGGDKYSVEIRLQFKMQNGCAMFSYEVHRWAELKRDAFGEMKDAIAEKTERPVFAGTHN